MKKKSKKQGTRNALVLPMNKRYFGNTIFKDRRTARGGNKNEQAELQEEYKEEKIDDDEWYYAD